MKNQNCLNTEGELGVIRRYFNGVVLAELICKERTGITLKLGRAVLIRNNRIRSHSAWQSHSRDLVELLKQAQCCFPKVFTQNLIAH